MTLAPTDLSVCLCAHNPHRGRFARALAALAAQTLPASRWELIIIDNRSEPPIAQWADLKPFLRARIAAEPELGLTQARVRAIREAAAPILVFVDDDNVLAPDYLERALAIMNDKPFLAAIGGRCLGEFEAPPPAWARLHLPYLAVADRGPAEKWGLQKNVYEVWYPYGAGLVLRRAAAELYVEQLAAHSERLALGRRGAALSGSEDIDLLMTIMDAGFGIGYFPQLSLRHLIPPERLAFDYMSRLVRQSDESLCRLLFSRGARANVRPWPITYLTNIALCLARGNWRPRALWLACQAARGRYDARRARDVIPLIPGDDQ